MYNSTDNTNNTVNEEQTQSSIENTETSEDIRVKKIQDL